MTNLYSRGSGWRKWDLHVHAPGTKLNNQYAAKDGSPDLDQFCKIIEESDVAVVAVTDYFSFDGYFSVKERYEKLYPRSNKLLLPNVELRLPVAVNKDGQNVNLHLIFNPQISKESAEKFISSLKTEGTSGGNRTRTTCMDLKSEQDFKSATVSIDSIEEAIKDTFGDYAVHRDERLHHLLVVASAKGDGIRVGGGSGKDRKNLLSDELDKYCDGFFGNVDSRDYFLNVDRLEGDQKTSPKPLYDGCDAHSFEDLTAGLGNHGKANGSHRNTTWIKADPTYAGLLQTLIEPVERVALQALEPDQKEHYKVIKRVVFRGTTSFPSEVVFNRNLTSIIGSRSSGKSALLSFMAHSVDPLETVRIQMEATGAKDEREVGPAAGFSWDSVSDVECEVEWESGKETSGRVIFVPQNSLYKLSEQPDEITKKIAPALFRTYPAVKLAYDATHHTVDAANERVQQDVKSWFSLTERIKKQEQQVIDVGDKSAIAAERDRLQTQIDTIKADSSLTDHEVESYQLVSSELAASEHRLREIGAELERLKLYVDAASDGDPTAHEGAVRVSITVRPGTSELSDLLGAKVDEQRHLAAANLKTQVEDLLTQAVGNLWVEKELLTAQSEKTKLDNHVLIEKHGANEALAAVVAEHKKQVEKLNKISALATALEKLKDEQAAVASNISTSIKERDNAFLQLSDNFSAESRTVTDLTFGFEAEVPSDALSHATLGINQRSLSDYVRNKGDDFDFEKAQADPESFLEALSKGDIKLNKSYEPVTVASEILCLTKDTRFRAELDGDRIGGFARSSMTPGKQALFALTLILNESQEPWPLLIDQPEDDLDSRSIYESIVPYLVDRKKERQIIMVSHNANLVIGADSELVIVANRHGDDRKNRDGQTFNYFSGSLEHSEPVRECEYELERMGVREHAVEILDGGEEAFQKRRDKYKL